MVKYDIIQTTKYKWVKHFEINQKYQYIELYFNVFSHFMNFPNKQLDNYNQGKKYMGIGRI